MEEVKGKELAQKRGRIGGVGWLQQLLIDTGLVTGRLTRSFEGFTLQKVLSDKVRACRSSDLQRQCSPWDVG